MINLAAWLSGGAVTAVLGVGIWVGGINSDVERLMNMEEDLKTIRETQIALVCKLVPEACPIKRDN